MEDIGVDRFLVLSGECPGEGVWCWAKTYTELVECVKSAWGTDFRPLFKYRLPCILTNANPHTHCEVGEEEEQPRQERPLIGEAEEAGLLVSTPSPARPSTCLVVLNDADDFHMWRYGGAYVLLAAAGASPAAKSRDERGAFVHHHGSPVGSAQGMVHAVSHHMDYHRLGSAAAMQGEEGEGHRERVWEPRPLTSTLYAFRSGAPAIGCLDALEQPSNHSCASSKRVRTRASPPVRRADSDAIQVPLQCILDPALVLRLGVTVVLRHSAAPAEVVLFSSHTPYGQGELPWGALCLKARHAWGVHSPQFRYLDVTHGVTQMLINHVHDYRLWARSMRLSNCELLVVEQAPSATRGAAFASAEAQAAITSYYQEEWPVERYLSSKSVVKLVRELKRLEREERIAAVERHGITAQAALKGDRTALTGTSTPLRVTNASSEPLQTDPVSASSSESAAVALPATLAGSLTFSSYRPLLLQTLQGRPSTTPAARRSCCCSTPCATSSTTSTQVCPPLTIDDRIDEEIRNSFPDAERYKWLMSLISPEHLGDAVVSSSGGQELKELSERVSSASPGGADTPLRQSPRWLLAKSALTELTKVAARPTPMEAVRTGTEAQSSQLSPTHLIYQEKRNGAVPAASAYDDAQVCTSVTAARKEAAAAASTSPVLHSNIATVDEPAADAHARARLHNALLSHHFSTHSTYTTKAYRIGATPIG
ncbi:hypothetical protein NXY56_001997 [Leishmania guyanensis]